MAKASRIIWVNGDVDPWHKQSNYKGSPGQDQPVLPLVKGAHHCAWMSPATNGEQASLVQARKEIWAQLDKWLESKPTPPPPTPAPQSSAERDQCQKFDLVDMDCQTLLVIVACVAGGLLACGVCLGECPARKEPAYLCFSCICVCVPGSVCVCVRAFLCSLPALACSWVAG